MSISAYRAFLILLCTLFSGLGQVYAASTDLVGSSAWSALLQGIKFDALSDTQANKAGTEIVGDATHPAMYVNYDDNGTTSGLNPELDDTLSFRIRIGDETKSTHSAYTFVGIEANGDGVLDAFVSSGAGDTSIWDAGTNANTSPSTTDLSNSAYATYTQNASNYNFASVSASNDPDWDGTSDLGPDGNTDVFVSFSIPVSALDAFLAEPYVGITFTPTTQLRFVSLTATQTNSLNSDFNGIGNSATDDWGQTYAALGILSDPITSSGIVDATPPTAPTVTPVSSSSSTPTITGTYDSADAAGGFSVTVNSVTYTLGVDAALSAVGNNWSLTIPAGNALGTGTYEVTATAIDGTGNAASDTSSNEVVIDTTPPSNPTVNTFSGNDTTPTITGTYDSADAAGSFAVTVNSVTYTLGVDAALSAVGNNWSLTIPAGNALGTGTYEVTATATDGAGNAASDTSSNEVVIDATPPSTPTVNALSGNDTTPTLNGTYDSSDAAGGFAVTVNSVTYTLGVDAAITAAGNNWSLTIPAGNALGTGTYEVTATATDGAGNAANDTSSNELVIDATPPTAPTVTPVSSSSSTPTITGTYDSADAAGGFSVTVNSVTYTLGVDAALSAVGNNWSLTIPAGNALGTGTYEVTATAIDGTGNAASDTSSNEVVIDTTPPSNPTVNTFSGNDTTPTITGTYDSADAAGSFAVTVNSVTYTLGVDAALSAVGNNWSLTIPAGNALGTGTYEVTATATDGAGNAASDTSSNEVVIDATPPSTPTVNALSGNDTTPTLTGTYDSSDAAGGFAVTVNSVTYTLGVDAAITAAGNNWSLTIPAGNALGTGTYEVTATATDGAGNAANDTSSNELVIDATPPTAPTVTPVSSSSSTPTITGTYDSADAAGGFSVTVNSVTYTLGVDAALSAVGNNWSLTIPAGNALGTGTYEVTATAIDGTGNAASDTSSNEVVIDTTPPSNPTVNTFSGNDTTPTITGTYDSADAAGSFAVTVNSVTYTLGVDAALSAVGNNWSLTIPAGNALGTGTYEVTATATDGAGNAASDTSSNEVVIDATPPSTPTVNALSGNDTTPTLNGTYDSSDAAGGFAVTVNSVTYTLGVDAAITAAGNNWSLTIPAGNALGTGTYEVTATATDGAGNAANDTSSNELVIDATPPTAPTVTPVSSSSSTPTITGTYDSADAAGGFSVTVNSVTYTLGVDAALSAVGNNWSLTIPAGNALGTGTYEVTATAIDGTGNAASDTSSNEVVIDTTPPSNPTVNTFSGNDTTPTITGTYDSADAAGSFAVTVNSVTYTLGVDAALSAVGNNWSLTIPAGNALGTGTYEVTATATDGAGNAASDTSSNEVVIDADSDGDGIINSVDVDDDNDGIPDSLEGDGTVDTDLDGVPDSLDLDADNDGLFDLAEAGVLLLNPDTNNDGRIDTTFGVGSNGLVDALETTPDSGIPSYSLSDSDSDGLQDYRDLDSDNDGLPDVIESGGSDPDADGRPGTGVPVVDASGVPSGGGLVAIDTDGDNVSDFRDLDADNDGLADLVEAGGTDSNGDGRVDGFIDLNNDGFDDGTAASPLTPPDDDADGTPDFLDSDDTDVDGVPDSVDLDNDNDGIPDLLEGNGAVDTDLDGVPDSLDLDADNDGLYDLDEAGLGVAGLDLNADGRIDLANPVGSNGLADAVETTAGSGAINYTPADSDADTVPDSNDRDSDNDGLFDVIESDGIDQDNDGVIGTGLPAVDNDGLSGLAGLAVIDTDSDLVPDYRDLDTDNDGLYDVVESSGTDPDNDGLLGSGTPVVDSNGVVPGAGLPPVDTDSDTVPNYRDRDSDNDGLTDTSEAGGSDPDGDGILGSGIPLVNAQGVPSGGGLAPIDTDTDGNIDTLDSDSDGDGVFDLVEAGGADSNNDGRVDGFTDSNGDGLDDGLATTPLVPPDTDGDGIPDYRDNDDTDNDGIPDSVDADDDNDAIPDILEGDALVDTDADGIPDSLDLDTDNDGIPDLTESGANYTLLDANGNGQVDAGILIGSNGLADSVETAPDSGVIVYNGGILLDTDSDGIADYRDRDSDNDGIFDVIEAGGSDPDRDGLVGSGAPVVNPQGVAGLLSVTDTDGDGIADQLDRDSDNDGIPDTIEAGVPDPDLDGVAGSGLPVTDGNGTTSGSGVTPPDSDSDGTPDMIDLDSDNDGTFDLVEAGGVDADNNGLVDAYMDNDGDGLDDGLAASPLPNLLQGPVIIETGLRGVGGCTISHTARADPTLLLFVIAALMYLRRRQLIHQERNDR